MTAAQPERLQEHLQRLFKSRERLKALLQDVTAKELSYADFLDQSLTEEVASKTVKHVSMRTQLARLPFVKRPRSEPGVGNFHLPQVGTLSCR
jgi:DNA replication protein DnaC